MYDVVVVGQGLSGMLAAIWAKEQGFSTALTATGTGKIMQSTGVMDLIPGSSGGLEDWVHFFQIDGFRKSQLSEAIDQFKALTNKLNYSYKGELDHPISIVTGSGHTKKTFLYPETISPLPDKGHVVIIGFEEIVDFQPTYVMKNLKRSCPALSVDAIKIQLGEHSQRTMSQLDAARLLDQKEIRSHCIKQIKEQMTNRNISQPNLFVFPASLGVENWKETTGQFSVELKAPVTEAPGMPPNTTAIRLNEKLKKEAVKLGVRFYADTTVVGCELEGDEVKSLKIKTSNQMTDLCGKHFILATGGILGGGLQVTSSGIKETALGLETDRTGALLHCPVNLYPVGASMGTQMTLNGITGGVFTIFSIREMIGKMDQKQMLGGIVSA
ncbi:FAD-binding protein [Neobacillus niacini]|uniref:FAD-binding protein n=1 Tax=Neobacillus niacini TaxID=86668 RepID=UPI0021CB094D|nr:FAD-binding protein [Neobacillus niacini]MCM3766741.1 FAD-binding protein [Neobacillus niacini]